MSRRALSTKARVALFQRHGGVCHICGGRIQAGEAWEVEHVVALALGGEDGGDNLAPAHVKCHRVKTAQDAKANAKAKRREAIHIGAKAPAQPFASRGFPKALPQHRASRPLAKPLPPRREA